MALIEVLMPKMGESITDATIIKWSKSIGDKVESEETLLEIATDKVDSEIPSPASGVLTEIYFKEDDVVEVGTVIGIISTEGEQPVQQPKEETVPPTELPNETEKPAAVGSSASIEMGDEDIEKAARPSNSERFYTPLVRSIASKEGIGLKELDQIQGSGKGGRVTKNDILQHIESKHIPQEAKLVTESQPLPIINSPSRKSVSGDAEIIEMDRTRKLIAEHMVRSKQTSAHVTSFVEADVTNIVNWRKSIKNDFKERHHENLTFTPIFIEAVVNAIKAFPLINVSVDGTKIIVKKDINIGMATALPSGNLIVPVIKKAQSLNLLGIAKSVNDLANRARGGQLKPDETSGGTFTLTNVGTFGNVMGTPIINQPQVAIMSTGVIKKKPAVIESEYGDIIAVRHMMFLSLSYDHRVVDGMLGGSFLRKVADYLEEFDTSRSI